MSQQATWADSPEAITAARKAVYIPQAKLGRRAFIIGREELESQALVILAECAQPLVVDTQTTCANGTCDNSLEGLRKGSKFCSRQCKNTHAIRARRGTLEAVRIPAKPKGHIGSLHTWPAGQEYRYAIQEIGLALCNWLRQQDYACELASTEVLDNQAADLRPSSELEIIVEWLADHGVKVTGEESFDDLMEAIQNVKKGL